MYIKTLGFVCTPLLKVLSKCAELRFAGCVCSPVDLHVSVTFSPDLSVCLQVLLLAVFQSLSHSENMVSGCFFT